MPSLREVFLQFCNFGRTGNQQTNEMESRALVKMMRDKKVLSKRVTSTDCDLAFAKVKSRGAKRITFGQFQQAIEVIAAKKGKPFDFVVAKLCGGAGPASSGTVAQANKFHDDKSLYTGVHAKGGPSTIDNRITLSNLSDRTDSDVRGRKVAGSSTGSLGRIRANQADHDLAQRASRMRVSGSDSPPRRKSAKAPTTKSSPTRARKSASAAGGKKLYGPERFFYDQNSYTGTHKRGGPSTIDNKPTLSNMCNRGASDIRGRNIGGY